MQAKKTYLLRSGNDYYERNATSPEEAVKILMNDMQVYDNLYTVYELPSPLGVYGMSTPVIEKKK